MKNSTKNDLELDIRLMLPEDAPGVVELYRSVYGDEYPIKSVYDVEGIIRQQNNGDMIRTIGVSNKGQVLGQTAIYRSCVSNPALYEEGQAIVLREYRNQGILERCHDYAHNQVYPQIMEQLWGEAVCNHVFTQKSSIRAGGYETGIELDLMPAASYQKEQSSSGRVAAVLFFKTYKALAQTLYLPEIYEANLRYLYLAYDFGHTFLPANKPLSAVPTRGQIEIYEGAGVARFTITELGSDLEIYLLQQEKDALSRNACVIQIYLNLASPATGAAIEILRKHQYFLGGVLPRWFDSDGLLMQKILHEPNYADIHLYSDRAQKILALIQADREAVMSLQILS
ncbi:MAG TPA: hypothetical protein PLC88_06225 [Syntrophomonas sp.]|nr:hypothetical protein [Syntrophomonas sp.]HRW12139.1 hypothetical protein [Syntrophomonas sp.]